MTGSLQAFNATVLTLAAQMLVGSAACLVLGAFGCARRRARVAWARGRRSLSRAAPFATAALLAAGFLQWRYAGWNGHVLEPASPFVPGLFTIAGAGLAAGCWLALDAARLEARGRLRAARAQIRLAGMTTSLAAGLMSAVVIGAWLVAAAPARGVPALERYGIPLGGLGIAATGVVVLLAGLARKPRPSAQLAAGMYVGSLFLVTAANVRGWTAAAATLSWFG